MISDDFDQTCADLIKKLVVIDPNERLGTQGYEKLKSHLFFDTIDWNNLSDQSPPS